MSHGGGCLCGAVRLSIAADPIAARQCWCRLCQYLSAGGGTVNAVFPADAVTVTGEVRWHASVADSGNAMQRGFCATCGTPLLSKADARPMHLIVRAGALDDPAIAAPQSAIWTSAAPPWACIDQEIPNLPGQPPPLG
ncbi:GFA family protein [Sphingomonas hengshuiensis]|uniref:Aldehyde-activating protein n=1 Tax=Sphingomonas hengshuiensis TaxID=1609977 RepID=A0A7U4J756_9SPHN|nr:GFA family protein [Sphingomonas hengshuiensis]AJP71485.1 aldehyde-activating protein [Sphingomonas hengshuiensis]